MENNRTLKWGSLIRLSKDQGKFRSNKASHIIFLLVEGFAFTLKKKKKKSNIYAAQQSKVQ